MGVIRVTIFLLFLGGALWSCRSGENTSIEIPQWSVGDTLTQVDVDLRVLTEAIQENPGVSENYYQRARLWMQKKELDLAVDDLEKALSIRPNVGKFLHLLGLIMVEKGQYRVALTALQKAESLNFSSSSLYIAQSKAYLGLGDSFNAQNAINKALKMDPYSSEPYSVLAELRLVTQDTLGAIANWKKVVSLYPKEVNGYRKLISLYQGKRWNDSVLLVNERAIALFPDSLDFQLSKAQTLASLYLLDSATVVYSQILRKNPKKVEAMWQLGALHVRKNRPELALSLYRTALSLSKDRVDAYMKTADLAETLNKPQEALVIYEMGLRNHPKNYNLELGVDRMKRKLQYISASKVRQTPVQNEPKNKVESTAPGKPEWRDIKPIRSRSLIIKKDSSGN